MTDFRHSEGTAEDALVGQLFEGRFEILSVIGEGGMGKVYKARHVHMDKVVAIKTLVSSALTDQKSFMRFKQESRAASSLGHPNIISIFDFGASVDGIAYLVMEFVEGKNLEDIIITQETMSLERFLRIFSQVCSGMQHAHKRGFIHRDLKPSNLMVFDTEDDTDVVKILDFGLAKACSGDDKQNLTRTGMVMGSPPFMSPEQCRGEDLDNRSDIYALGCVMFAALTGEVPLLGDNTMATLYKHISGVPSSIADVAPHLLIPESLERLIMKTLEKQPGDRPQSMGELGEEMAASINAYLSGRTAPGSASRPMSPPVRAQGGGGPGEDRTSAVARSASLRGALQQSMLRQSVEPNSPGGLAAQESISNTKFTQKPPVQSQTVVPQGASTAPEVDGAKGKDTLRKLRSETPTSAPSGPRNAANKSTMLVVGGALVLVVGAVCCMQFLSGGAAVRPASSSKVSVSSTPESPVAAAGAPSGTATSPAANSNTASTASTTPVNTATGAAPAATVPTASAVMNKAIATGNGQASSNSSSASYPVRTKVNPGIFPETISPAAASSNQRKTVAPVVVRTTGSAASGSSTDHGITPSPGSIRQATQEARQFQTKALQAYGDGKMYVARDFALKELAREKIIYGAQSPALLPTLGLIAGCCRNASECQKIDHEMDLAMTIYGADEARAEQSLNSAKYAFDSWYSLGAACFELSKASGSANARQRYLQWTQIFFKGARSSWSEPQRGPVYFQMLRKYIAASTQLGDMKLASALGMELHPNGPLRPNGPLLQDGPLRQGGPLRRLSRQADLQSGSQRQQPGNDMSGDPAEATQGGWQQRRRRRGFN